MKNLLATIFAILSGLAWAVLAYLLGDEMGLDPILAVALLAAPLLALYAVACVRNGTDFTVIWASILAGAVVGVVVGADASNAGVLMFCFVPLFIGGIIVHALAYKPELGTFGKLVNTVRAWRPGGIMPTSASIMDRVRKAGNFGSDVQMAWLIALLIGVNCLDILVHVMV